jgi:DNA-binding XRE family transcriptional regulator
LTPAEVDELRKVRASIARELPAIRARAITRLILKAAGEAASMLKAERKRRGFSLKELKQITGIQKSVLSQLENNKQSNPTLKTLMRYAQALGKRVEIRLVDDPTSTKR